MRWTILVVVLTGLLSAQDEQSCPMHQQHAKAPADHYASVETHGEQAMGFPHDKTTHHFLLYPDGGAIEITANNPKDAENIEAIRSHLRHIATMFSEGNFSMPMFVHGQVPPGVPVMTEQREHISYDFAELTSGGKVLLKTSSPDALKAIHEFLRFQIEDHRTGDTREVGF